MGVVAGRDQMLAGHSAGVAHGRARVRLSRDLGIRDPGDGTRGTRDARGAALIPRLRRVAYVPAPGQREPIAGGYRGL